MAGFLQKILPFFSFGHIKVLFCNIFQQSNFLIIEVKCSVGIHKRRFSNGKFLVHEVSSFMLSQSGFPFFFFFQEIMQHKLVFIETQDVVETTLALDNYRKACDCGRGAVFFSVAR